MNRLLTFLLIINSFSYLAQRDSIYDDYLEALIFHEDVYTLNQSGIGLDELTSDIKIFKNLEVLYIDGNNLKTLPKEIGELKKLRELYLGYYQEETNELTSNPLRTLPMELNQCDSLIYISILDCQFETIPPVLLNSIEGSEYYLEIEWNKKSVKNKQDLKWLKQRKETTYVYKIGLFRKVKYYTSLVE